MTASSTDTVYFLLVDDLPENLTALEGLLRRDGLVLLKARSGPDALELLLKYDIGLALVDVQMPGMDGYELAELMRGSERTRRVPIIFVTAGAIDRHRPFRGYEAGAVDFLHKPIDPDILKSKVDVFFELCRQRQELIRQRDELTLKTKENELLLQASFRYAEVLKESDRRKNDFLAMLAHELRNPLGPMRNAVEVLRRVGHDEKAVRKASDIIFRQVHHMARLVDDLLDTARIARGQITICMDPCDLAKIVRNTAEDYRPAFAAAEVNLHVESPGYPLPLIGDSTRLAQALGNLLHNSLKFTPRGGNVYVRLSKSADAQAHLSVQDTGAGMEPELLARVFEQFSQAERTPEREKSGLGLGLALVRGLVELHGGDVSANSEGGGRGSTFTVRLPLAPEATPFVEGDVGQGAMPSAGLRIVIIEDNRDAAESLRLLLTMMRHEVRTAHSGRDGVALVREFRPHIVLSDIGLPGQLNGYAVAKAIREDSAVSKTYLVALSGYGQDDDRRRALDAGFDHYLVKPIYSATLESLLFDLRKRLNSESGQ